MTKYFISRVLLLLIGSIFIGWAFSAWKSEQLYNFFNIDFWSIFKTFVASLILIIGSIILNFSFTLLYWNEILLDNFIVETDEVKHVRFDIILKFSIDYKFSIIQFAFKYEKHREKYPILFCVLAFLFTYPIFFKGTPFINNYCAIYETIEVEGRNSEPLRREIPSIVVPKNEVNDVKNKGYVFFQAALIDGFKSYHDNDGIVSYIACLPFYALEKLIRVLMLFLLPFIIGIIVIERLNGKNGKNEERWNIAKVELEKKMDALKKANEIILKYQLDKSPHINNALLFFEKGLFESKIVLSKKNLFDAQTLLFSINSFRTLIHWSESALHEKTFAIIKNNFEMYHFSDSLYENPLEKAKKYLAELEADLEKNKYLDGRTLNCLLSYIPENEIEIDSSDIWELERIKNVLTPYR